MRVLPDARPLRGGCLFVVALKAAAGGPRGGGEISTKNETAKKACKTQPSTPKDPRETPKTTNHDGTVAPSGHPWPPAKGPKRGPQDTLGAPRGPPKQRHIKSQSPLTKNAEDKKRTQKTHPKSDRHLRGHALRGAAPPLRGAFFGDAAARRKHKNHHVTPVLDPKGAKTLKNLVFYEGS